MRDLRKTDFGGRGNAELSEGFYQGLKPELFGEAHAGAKAPIADGKVEDLTRECGAWGLREDCRTEDRKMQIPHRCSSWG